MFRNLVLILKEYDFDKKQILMTLLVMVGLGGGLILIRQEQYLTSRASQEVYNNLEISQQTTSGKQQVACATDGGCTVQSLEVDIKVKAALPTPTPVPVRSTAFGSCTFYRQGQGEKFHNSTLPGVISEVAGNVGIPASILAGIMRIESPSAFASGDNQYVLNDYDAHSSGIAYGVMQFTPSTFRSTFEQNKAEISQKFGKTAVVTTVEPQAYPAPSDNVLRIYSIRDSLIIGAYKIRADASSGAPYDRAAIERVLSAYFGSHCGYEGSASDYCTDLQKDQSECGNQ